MCSHCQGQSVSYRKQDLRQALRDGQGLREDWRALREKERVLGEVGVTAKTPSVSMVPWREQGWDGGDEAWKKHGLWNPGKQLGSGTPLFS